MSRTKSGTSRRLSINPSMSRPLVGRNVSSTDHTAPPSEGQKNKSVQAIVSPPVKAMSASGDRAVFIDSMVDYLRYSTKENGLRLYKSAKRFLYRFISSDANAQALVANYGTDTELMSYMLQQMQNEGLDISMLAWQKVENLLLSDRFSHSIKQTRRSKGEQHDGGGYDDLNNAHTYDRKDWNRSHKDVDLDGSSEHKDVNEGESSEDSSTPRDLSPRHSESLSYVLDRIRSAMTQLESGKSSLMSIFSITERIRRRLDEQLAGNGNFANRISMGEDCGVIWDEEAVSDGTESQVMSKLIKDINEVIKEESDNLPDEKRQELEDMMINIFTTTKRESMRPRLRSDSTVRSKRTTLQMTITSTLTDEAEESFKPEFDDDNNTEITSFTMETRRDTEPDLSYDEYWSQMTDMLENDPDNNAKMSLTDKRPSQSVVSNHDMDTSEQVNVELMNGSPSRLIKDVSNETLDNSLAEASYPRDVKSTDTLKTLSDDGFPAAFDLMGRSGVGKDSIKPSRIDSVSSTNQTNAPELSTSQTGLVQQRSLSDMMQSRTKIFSAESKDRALKLSEKSDSKIVKKVSSRTSQTIAEEYKRWRASENITFSAPRPSLRPTNSQVKESPTHRQSDLIKSPTHRQSDLIKSPTHRQSDLIKSPTNRQSDLINDPRGSFVKGASDEQIDTEEMSFHEATPEIDQSASLHKFTRVSKEEEIDDEPVVRRKPLHSRTTFDENTWGLLDGVRSRISNKTSLGDDQWDMYGHRIGSNMELDSLTRLGGYQSDLLDDEDQHFVSEMEVVGELEKSESKKPKSSLIQSRVSRTSAPAVKKSVVFGEETDKLMVLDKGPVKRIAHGAQYKEALLEKASAKDGVYETQHTDIDSKQDVPADISEDVEKNTDFIAYDSPTRPGAVDKVVVASYLSSHGIYDLLQFMMTALVTTKPEDPIDFLIKMTGKLNRNLKIRSTVQTYM